MLSALLRQLSTGSLLLYCTARRKDCVTLYKFHCSYSLLPPPHCSTVLTDIKGGNVLKEGESCGKETVTSAGKCPRFFFFFFLKCMMWSENTSLRGSNDYFWAIKGSIPTRGPFLVINAGWNLTNNFTSESWWDGHEDVAAGVARSLERISLRESWLKSHN